MPAEQPTSPAARGRGRVPVQPDDHLIVVFGATGDLAKRKLLPGLFHLDCAGMMPGNYRIIATAPDDSMSDRRFRSYVHQVLADFARPEVTDQLSDRFVDRISFAPSTIDDPDRLVDAVEHAEHDLGDQARRLLYLSVPPAAVPRIVEMVGRQGLNQRARVVVEKPFGVDLASARALNGILHSVFAEEQIYRIDHFLGKEAVQNLLSFRFANGMFESMWNREHIAYVQIDVPEQLTVEQRGLFYEQTGAFRDMVVTHLLETLGFVAMEPPVRLDATSLRTERDKVFDALEPLDPARAIFGQYRGYRDVPDVNKNSRVETFVALEVKIANWRWAEIPFYLRTGKALAQSRHIITVGFREPPLRMFGLPPAEQAANELSFDLADPGSISLSFMTKQPGATLDLLPARLAFRYGDSFTSVRALEAYERLLHDAMIGDHTLFTSTTGIERLWAASAPLTKDPPPPLPYSPGTWGPQQINTLLAPHRWHLPDEAKPRTGSRRVP
jgi:glucose-6-phosphate 1-dehydrogenase